MKINAAKYTGLSISEGDEMRYLLVLLLIVILVSIILACAPAATGTATPSPSATTPSPSATTTSPPVSTGQTFGQLAEVGQTVFRNNCSVCHGQNGQGVSAPAIIGSNANLEKFNNARGLLDFISTAMPAFAPGSLSQSDYFAVLSFLLIRNGYASEDTAANPDQLDEINLE